MNRSSGTAVSRATAGAIVIALCCCLATMTKQTPAVSATVHAPYRLAAAKPHAKASKKKKHTIKARPITLVLNGQRLMLDPSPIVYNGRLLVPLRRIIEALGLDFQVNGTSVTTHIGYKTITLQLNSQRADINGAPVDLGTPPIQIKYVFYVPLRFFTSVLDAQARFDSRAGVVSITAQVVGVTGDGITYHGDQVEEVGTATAVNLNSNPPTVTITYNASIRTLQILPNAQVSLQDVDANVTVPGELSDIHPGDFVHLYGDRNGGMQKIVDQFGSHSGTVEAIAGNQMVLDTGDVIVPNQTTTYTIDGKPTNASGAPASLSDIKPGTRVTVRYNVYSGEVREIAVGEATGQNPAVRGTPPGVSDFAPDDGDVVNSNQPAIYASFAADGSPINPSSIVILVNGRDVTAASVRTDRFIEYMPGIAYPDGLVRVTVRVADTAGNSTTKSWAFRIKTH